MKKAMFYGALALAATLPSASAYAADPCASVLCMFGLISGQNSSSCNQPIADYFGIVNFRHGHPDLGATSSSRLAFTQQCPGAGQAIGAVSQAFGSVIK
jgi:hypothetical protein